MKGTLLREQSTCVEPTVPVVPEEKIAIVIPTRNRSDLLRECLSSLAQQEFPAQPCEVLVCDDGSTEDLLMVVDQFRLTIPNLRLLTQSARGPAAARNMGIRSTNAEIIICLDSDVECASDFVKRVAEALGSHPDWIAAEARILPKGDVEGPLWDAPECETGGRYHTAAMAYRRLGLFAAGGFDETFPFPACEDAEKAARLLKHGAIGFVPEAVVFHSRRRVTLRTHWAWRQHWKYVMILAKRYGFLAFPGRTAGRLPRFRVGLAAVLTLPGGRFLNACRYLRTSPIEALIACSYALFDIICGVSALPEILFGAVPPRKDYLSCQGRGSELS